MKEYKNRKTANFLDFLFCVAADVLIAFLFAFFTDKNYVRWIVKTSFIGIFVTVATLGKHIKGVLSLRIVF